MKDDISIRDKQWSSGEEDFCDAGEDYTGYLSARSHFSDDEEIPIPASDDEITEFFSEAEVQRLNAKIDRLIAALAGGRHIHFEHSPVTGYFDVVASNPTPSSDRGGGELEAEIAAAPQNLGNIISSRRQLLRSPNSIQYAMTSSSFPSEIGYKTWEEVIAAADERYEHERGLAIANQEDKVAAAELRLELEHRASLRDGIKIRRALRLQEQALGEPRGRRLAMMGPSGVEIHEISPIPLDFNKTLRTSTPSQYSSDSQIACISPLFLLNYPDMVRYADTWATTSDSDDVSEQVVPTDRISEWLEGVEMPPQARTPMVVKGRSKSVEVFRDTTAGEGSARSIQDAVSTDDILRDLSNLRRPGYLHHNSFAQEKTSLAGSLQQAKGSGLARRTFGRVPDTEGRQSLVKSKRPGLLSPVPEQDSPAPSDKPLEHPERVAHFEFALARLEGRAPPEPSSPMRRYVHTSGVYGGDVEVDLGIVSFRQPRPVRYTDGPCVAQQLEQALGEAHQEHSGNEKEELSWG